jgi:hypothetical protein
MSRMILTGFLHRCEEAYKKEGKKWKKTQGGRLGDRSEVTGYF